MLEQVMSVIRHNTSGVVITLAQYGRGADIRFKKDSFVIIGYIPVRLDIVSQMIGRSSRTMKIHQGKLIGVDKHLTAVSLVDKLKASNGYQMRDGIRVAKILIGQYLAGNEDDSKLAKALKNEWRVDIKRLSSVLSRDATVELERIGSRVKDFPMIDDDITNLKKPE